MLEGMARGGKKGASKASGAGPPGIALRFAERLLRTPLEAGQLPRHPRSGHPRSGVHSLLVPRGSVSELLQPGEEKQQEVWDGENLRGAGEVSVSGLRVAW